MNEGVFLEGIRKSGVFLKDNDLLAHKNLGKNHLSNPRKFSADFRGIALKDDYFKIYKVAMENCDYDFLYVDESFIQYSYSHNKNIVRMAFYPNPNVLTYKEFLKKIKYYDYKMVGESYMDDYQQFLSEQNPIHVTPIRYDYNTESHTALVHHTSHLHFGIGNDIRVGINKILTPLAFTKIICNFFFLDVWKRKIGEGTTFIDALKRVKSSCYEVSDEFFCEVEKSYFYIV